MGLRTVPTNPNDYLAPMFQSEAENLPDAILNFNNRSESKLDVAASLKKGKFILFEMNVKIRFRNLNQFYNLIRI